MTIKINFDTILRIATVVLLAIIALQNGCNKPSGEPDKSVLHKDTSAETRYEPLPPVIQYKDRPVPVVEYRDTGSVKYRSDTIYSACTHDVTRVYIDSLRDTAGLVIVVDTVDGELRSQQITFVPNMRVDTYTDVQENTYYGRQRRFSLGVGIEGGTDGTVSPFISISGPRTSTWIGYDPFEKVTRFGIGVDIF